MLEVYRAAPFARPCSSLSLRRNKHQLTSPAQRWRHSRLALSMLHGQVQVCAVPVETQNTLSMRKCVGSFLMAKATWRRFEHSSLSSIATILTSRVPRGHAKVCVLWKTSAFPQQTIKGTCTFGMRLEPCAVSMQVVLLHKKGRMEPSVSARRSPA